MKLYYAHYPALEEHFVQFVRTHRTNPLDKWLIVCCSSYLAQHLQTRLARQLGAVANLYFVTPAMLLTRLDQEAPGQVLPLLPQDHVRDFLIKEILNQPGLNRYALSRGFVQAVKSSLRDLADSLADPDVLREHLLSMPDYVLEQDGGRFAWLVEVYKQYLARENTLPGYRPYQTAFERALNGVETSSYLAQFSQHIIYGFYDMPGRQLELMDRLRACYDVTVFAPYQKHPAYTFAQKFFETNWLTSPGAQDVNEPAPPTALGASAPYIFASSGSAPNERVQIVSAPDLKGSIFYVAKEISKLLAGGQSPADIAVLVRNTQEYQDEIRRTFQENCLPLSASFTYPLYKSALGRLCLNLFELASCGFARENVLSVFSSPYFKQENKFNWCRLVNRSLVSRDVSQWNDLLPQTAGFDPEVLNWINATHARLEGLSAAQPWQQGVQAALAFLAEQVDTHAFEPKDAQLYQQIEETLRKMITYAAVRPQCHDGELISEIAQALSSVTYHEVENVPAGITFTDALRARGLRFKTVFVLGLNDQEFPLLTPEDPILRDYYRHHLRDTLGYWLNASLDRADEEKLLFYNAISAASEQLYVLYSRYNTEGKPAVPSVYVTQLARACELDLQAPDAPRVSGVLWERLRTCDEALLTPKEISYRIALSAHPQEKYKQLGVLDPHKERSLNAAQALANWGELTAYDGVIAQGEELFVRENKHGFSPSALQELGTCPLKYFFNRGLHLGEPEEPASRQMLPANKQGTAYHEILKEFYQTLVSRGELHGLFDQGLAAHMQQTVAHYYTEDSYRRFGIYPVVWEIILENIRQKLSDFAVQDANGLGPFVPQLFEQEFVSQPNGQLPLRLRGIVDRMDVDPTAQTFRIADYKSTRKGTANLAKDFFTRLVLQPVLYIWMVQQQTRYKKYQTAGSCLLSIDPYSKRDLSAQQYQAIKEPACKFLLELVRFIQTGRFFMCPGEGCTYCAYGLLCRKDAFKPLVRAQQSPGYARLKEARHYES